MRSKTEFERKQYRLLPIFIGLTLLVICCLFLITPAEGISLDEIKNYVIPSSGSGGTVINNYYTNFYQTNYTIAVQALTSTPTDNVLNYFGNKPSAFTTTAGQNKIYFSKAGNITTVEIFQYSGTAGSNERYNLTIVKNGVREDSKGFIKELSIATNERRFNNYTLRLPVLAGDYIELVFRNPVWVTNPLTTITGGYIEVSP